MAFTTYVGKGQTWILHHENKPSHTPLLVVIFGQKQILMLVHISNFTDLIPCAYFMLWKAGRSLTEKELLENNFQEGFQARE
jgi:hypothetical protein